MAGLADFFDGKTLSHSVSGFWNQIGGGAWTMEKLQAFSMEIHWEFINRPRKNQSLWPYSIIIHNQGRSWFNAVSEQLYYAFHFNTWPRFHWRSLSPRF